MESQSGTDSWEPRGGLATTVCWDKVGTMVVMVVVVEVVMVVVVIVMMWCW